MESQPSPELSSTAIADLAMDMELGSPGLAHSVVRKRSCRLHMSPMLYDGMGKFRKKTGRESLRSDMLRLRRRLGDWSVGPTSRLTQPHHEVTSIQHIYQSDMLGNFSGTHIACDWEQFGHNFREMSPRKRPSLGGQWAQEEDAGRNGQSPLRKPAGLRSRPMASSCTLGCMNLPK